MDSSKDSADAGYVICSSVTDIKAHEQEKYEDENPGNVYMELGTPDYEKIQDSAVILKPKKTDKGYMMPVEIHDPGYSKLNNNSSDSPYELPVHVVRPFQNETSSKKTSNLTDTSFHKSESKPPLPERNQVKSKRSKRPFLIGCVIFILTIITCSLVTVVVLYINKKGKHIVNYLFE
ncbi:uncharacterized protein LOC134232056 [Saccostrea cucullata]|uniref:uncharacterized protein LOC134232056 n=1 Tax=Saccostrea cuccullata TaxID=36930 RepID=UPI002ED5CA00